MRMCTARRAACLLSWALTTGAWAQSPPPLDQNLKLLVANFRADELAVTHFRVHEHVVLDKGSGAEGRTYLVRYVNGHAINETVALDDRTLSPAELSAEHARAEERAQLAASRPPPPEGVIEFNRREYPFDRLAADYVYGDGHAIDWNGRTTWVYPATPNRAVTARSREEKILLDSDAEIWVDAEDLHVVRIRVRTNKPVAYGLGLLAEVRTATLDLEMERQAPGVWLPSEADFRLSGTLLMAKPIVRSRQQTFFSYTPAS